MAADWKWLIVLGASALAAACQTPAEDADPVATPAAETPEPAEPEPSVAEETPLPVPEPEPAPPPPDPDDLLGLEPAAIQDLLGPVSLKRWEGDAQVMQFRNQHCIMDFYFYEDAPGAPFRVAYLSARLPDGAEISTSVCLEALLPEGRWPDGFREAHLPGR